MAKPQSRTAGVSDEDLLRMHLAGQRGAFEAMIQSLAAYEAMRNNS